MKVNVEIIDKMKRLEEATWSYMEYGLSDDDLEQIEKLSNRLITHCNILKHLVEHRLKEVEYLKDVKDSIKD